MLTLTTPRTDDPLAGVTAPVSGGANPAAGHVSHLQQLQAEMVSHLPVPLAQVSTSPLLAHQHTPRGLRPLHLGPHRAVARPARRRH